MAEKKPVSFRVPEDVSKLIDQLREKSGMEPGDWFTTVIQTLAEKDILEGTVRISPDLAKAFESDVTKLNTALDVVRQTYINQMSGLKNHMDKLEQQHQKQVDDIIAKHQQQLSIVATKRDELEMQLKNAIEERHQAEQFAKEIRHERELLDKDFANLSTQLESAHDTIKQRDERITGLTNDVVMLNSERAKIQGLHNENESCHAEISRLRDASRDFEGQTASLAAELERVRTKAKLDTATAIAQYEAETQQRIADRFEDYQNRINALHDKLEAERDASTQLRTEMSILRNKLEAEQDASTQLQAEMAILRNNQSNAD